MSDPVIGRQLGDYVIQELLGRGGMARVYRGYDPRLMRHAALKIIANDFTSEDQVEYTERFRKEARAIARLNHPNIVGVYQFGEQDDLYYMAMVFIEGRDLRQIIREATARSKVVTMDMALTVVKGISAALDYAHARGVIHRDVKPSNVMIDTENHPVLTDFGLALSTADGTLGDTFGSAHYIAPEQAISSARAVPQSDLYSLGICLYEMLTGYVPFDDPSAMTVAMKHLNETPPSPRIYNPAIPVPVERVILRALEKDPHRRYDTGAQMAQAFEAAVMHREEELQRLLNATATSTNQAVNPLTGTASNPMRLATSSRPAVPSSEAPPSRPAPPVPSSKTSKLDSATLREVDLPSSGIFPAPNRTKPPSDKLPQASDGTASRPSSLLSDSRRPTGEHKAYVNLSLPGQVVDTGQNTPKPATLKPQVQSSGSGRSILLVVAAVLVVAVVGGILFILSNSSARTSGTPTVSAVQTEAPTQVALVNDSLTPTLPTATEVLETAMPTEMVGDAPTEGPTITRTRRPTLPPPPTVNTVIAVTNEPTEAVTVEPVAGVGTDAPTSASPRVSTTPKPPTLPPTVPTETPRPTVTPTHTALVSSGSATPAGPDIRLLYNRDQINVLNISGRTLNVAQMVFVQRGARERRFEATLWDSEFAINSANSWPNGRCYQASRSGLGTLQMLPGCTRLTAFRSVRDVFQFWVPQDAEVTAFEVMFRGTSIKTCEISAGRCEFSLPR